MYRQSELGIFKNDPHYSNLAYTTTVLPNSRIGLIGLCMNATTEDLQRTWGNNYSQVLIGLAQVIVGIALTIIGAGIIL